MRYPDAWGLKYEEVLGLTWLAYRGRGTSGNWRIGSSAWSIGEIHEHGSFRAVVATGTRKVLSLSGTDDAGDWGDNLGQGVAGLSAQYLRALRLANSVSPDVVVGHSLGGGMASYCAIYGGRNAATVNPAPLNINLFSGVQMLRNGNRVINYVAPGEVLAILDAAALNMTKVGRTYSVRSNGGWNPIDRHSIENMDGFIRPVRS